MEDHSQVALKLFLHQPVKGEMISFLADAAIEVIQPGPMVTAHDLPTLDEFIIQLVVKSNVQVPTLMSTLVFLTRLKFKLQGKVSGQRCTPHRIFLASLILAAKYLNDNSPKNKRWASYTHINTNVYSFGFNHTEVNSMEKQLLFLLDWELRITEQDLYRELGLFLQQHAAMLIWHGSKRREGTYAVTAGSSLWDASQFGPTTPPSLTRSAASSCISSSASSPQQSHSNTPLESQPKSGLNDSRPQVPYDAHIGFVVEPKMAVIAPAPLSGGRLLNGGCDKIHEAPTLGGHRCIQLPPPCPREK